MPACQAITVCWHATAGWSPAGSAARRYLAPWYRGKAEPSTVGMAARLHRVLIVARFKRTSPDQVLASTDVVYGVTGTDVTGLPEYGVSP